MASWNFVMFYFSNVYIIFKNMSINTSKDTKICKKLYINWPLTENKEKHVEGQWNIKMTWYSYITNSSSCTKLNSQKEIHILDHVWQQRCIHIKA